MSQWEVKSLQIFPLDRIHRNKVEDSVDQDTLVLKTFDWLSITKAIDLEHYFDNCVGIYRNYLVDKVPSVVYRWLKGWAASHVEAVPLHKSQQVVQRSGAEIRIRLEVYDTKELKGVLAKYGKDCWE